MKFSEELWGTGRASSRAAAGPGTLEGFPVKWTTHSWTLSAV